MSAHDFHVGQVVLSPAPPPAPLEPPKGSVVLDYSGDAWQRGEGAWTCASDFSISLRWPELVKRYEPLKIIHVGEQAPPAFRVDAGDDEPQRSGDNDPHGGPF